MKVAIVILNYNGQKFLEKFLPIVIENSPEGEIFVADNASTDDSLPFLQTNFPSIKTISIPVNKGYAGGYNFALQKIDADWFVLMNSDISPKPNWLKSILDYLQKNPTVKAAQPYILKESNPEDFEYAGAAGGYLDYLGYPFCRGRIFDTLEKNQEQFESVNDLNWATGACLVVEKNTYWQAGGLDEFFFAHQEEIDLCCRIKKQGHQIAAVKESKVLHVGGGTLQADNPRKTYLNFRNNLILIYKNYPSKNKGFILLLRLLLDGAAGVKFLFEGKISHIWAIIQAHFGFYGYLIFNKKKQTSEGKYPLNTYPKSIIWQYFIHNKKRYSELP